MNDTLTIDETWVGKYVKLRNGRQAYISGIIPEEVCRGFRFSDNIYFSGVENCEDGEDRSWRADGRHFSWKQSEHDIIGLWVDEEPADDEPLSLTQHEIRCLRKHIRYWSM